LRSLTIAAGCGKFIFRELTAYAEPGRWLTATRSLLLIVICIVGDNYRFSLCLSVKLTCLLPSLPLEALRCALFRPFLMLD
jgi:hypothetical protein